MTHDSRTNHIGRDRWFRVEVSDHEGQIVAIESEMLTGREIGDAERETIDGAIDCLCGFIGRGYYSTEISPPVPESAPLTPDLLPCPFCGRAPVTATRPGFHGFYTCPEYECPGSSVEANSSAWNQRTESARISQLEAELARKDGALTLFVGALKEVAPGSSDAIEALAICAGLRDRAEKAEAELATATDALRELVRLKDLHDRVERAPRYWPAFNTPMNHDPGEVPRMKAEYERCKPLAWEAARKVVPK